MKQESAREGLPGSKQANCYSSGSHSIVAATAAVVVVVVSSSGTACRRCRRAISSGKRLGGASSTSQIGTGNERWGPHRPDVAGWLAD